MAGSARGIRPVIPFKANKRRRPGFPRERYRERNLIENLFCDLKQNRRIAMRYDKTDQGFAAFIHLAALRLALR